MIKLYVTRLQPDDSHLVIGQADDGSTCLRHGLTEAQVRSGLRALRPGVDYVPLEHSRNILADVLANS